MGDVWKFRHRIRDDIVVKGELEMRHLAGRETLITAEVGGALQHACEVSWRKDELQFTFLISAYISHDSNLTT